MARHDRQCGCGQHPDRAGLRSELPLRPHLVPRGSYVASILHSGGLGSPRGRRWQGTRAACAGALFAPSCLDRGHLNGPGRRRDVRSGVRRYRPGPQPVRDSPDRLPPASVLGAYRPGRSRTLRLGGEGPHRHLSGGRALSRDRGPPPGSPPVLPVRDLHRAPVLPSPRCEHRCRRDAVHAVLPVLGYGLEANDGRDLAPVDASGVRRQRGPDDRGRHDRGWAGRLLCLHVRRLCLLVGLGTRAGTGRTSSARASWQPRSLRSW